MANKGAVTDYILITKINNDKAFDLYNALCRIAVEKNIDGSNHYIVKTSSDSRYSLYTRLINEFSYFNSKSTIYSILDVFIDKGIIVYDINLNYWTLPNLSLAVRPSCLLSEDEKKNRCGYLTLKEFFFNINFYQLKKNEKRILVYALLSYECLNNKRQRKKFKNVYKADFFLDISKAANKNQNRTSKNKIHWDNLVNSNNIYYIREVYTLFLANNKDLVERVFDGVYRNLKYTCKSSFQFKFNFNQTVLKNVSSAIDYDLEFLTLKNSNKYRMALYDEIISYRECELELKPYVQSFRYLITIRDIEHFKAVADRFIRKVVFSTGKISSVRAYLEGTYKSMIKQNEI